VQIDMLAKKLREQRAFIARAVEREDFDEAKLIKENIQKIKADIRDILEDDAEEEQPSRADEEN
jgi:protein-arginine kinase activator protein McsA